MGERFHENRSATYEKAVSAMKDLCSKEDTCLAAFADATADQFKSAWIKQNGLKKSQGACCIHRLNGKKCLNGQHDCFPPGSDHAELWNQNSKPFVFTSQPYGLSHKTMIELNEFCEEHDLTYSISAHPAYHYPSRVLFLEFKAI